LVVSFALALDIYIPLVPKMIDIMYTTNEKIQLTLSLYTLTLGIGQLFFGPLSDQLGRKKVVILSVSLFFIGSLFCALSNTIEMLIISRIIQALGACGSMVTSFSIVRDSFSKEDIGKVYGYLNGSISLAPLIAPFLGSYIDMYFGWRAVFWFLCIFSLYTLLLNKIKLKETLPISKRVQLSNSLLKRYKNIFLNSSFMFYTYCVSSGVACFFTFFSVSPYIIMISLKRSEEFFGICFGSVGLIFFISGLCSGFLSKKLGIQKTTLLGCFMLFCGGLSMLLWYIVAGLSIIGFIVPMYIGTIGISMISGTGTAGALMPFPHLAGSASAVMGCCQFLLASIVSTFIMRFQITTPLPLAYILMILPSISILWYYLKRKI
jgi:Bcr/CflA subfamily drug resistance transporter